ncbi:6-phosphogluconolactonase [Actinopolyspora lacussalsi subsp. righensis]|uniref:6-phosphogluconolactonase n=1 Tax=Actinopolyspora righensis TaxID=995060 RepID=A0A1I6XJ87_9ACTN|nr:6-phosphogluconolactonase [Actinopolyspora righensis]SFT38438.1 6-phosphogluconolactonase [Actinopolyspora righensis]
MSDNEVIVHPDAEVLAEATAARLLTSIVDAQAARGVASVVLTGGRTGIGVLERVRDSIARSAVDWSAVNLFWGDERFLTDGDGERNETQARAALLDHVPLDPRRVHPMAPSDGRFGADAESAADHYAEVLRTLAGTDSDTGVPRFDVLLLGVGEEGHTASLFPDTPYVRERERTAVAVRDCPKPPPTRISLTLPAIASASEVWLMTTGAGKAEAVSRALTGADPVDIPAAGARGRDRTLWLLDREAAKDSTLGG